MYNNNNGAYAELDSEVKNLKWTPQVICQTRSILVMFICSGNNESKNPEINRTNIYGFVRVLILYIYICITYVTANLDNVDICRII